MAGDERQLRARQLAVDDVQVGPADAAREDAQQHLARPRLRHGQVAQLERLALRLEDHRAHGPIVRPGSLSSPCCDSPASSVRHKRLVVALWLLVLLGGVPNLQRATNALSQQFSVPGREGFETNVALFHRYGIDPSVSTIIPVFRLPAGTSVTSPGVRTALGAALDRATAAVPGSRAVSYASTRSAAFVSADGRTTFAVVYIPFKANRGFTGTTAETDAVRAALQKARPAGAAVHVTGYDALNDSASGGKGPGVLLEALLGRLRSADRARRRVRVVHRARPDRDGRVRHRRDVHVDLGAHDGRGTSRSSSSSSSR